jgi:hypothetical protein
MVRTECRKCKHSNKNHSACMVVRQRKDVADWMGSIETEWISPNEHMVMEQAIAPTLCPGFEATPDKSSVVAAPADTISVEPRKRSEGCGCGVIVTIKEWEKNGSRCPKCSGDMRQCYVSSQVILDGSKVSEIPTGCQCAAGPWRSDVENAPEGVYLLFYCKGCTTPFCGMRWKENTWSGANRCTCNGGGGINEFPDSEITRFAVIGGK